MGMNNFVLNANDIIFLIANIACLSYLMLNNKFFLKLTHMEFIFIFSNFLNCFGPVSRVACLLLPKFPYTEFALTENLRRLLIRSDHFGVHARLGKAL